MTKIDIISGFLGAGKTTLIKKLIEQAFKGEKLVLIENEFGEIGIDGGFLKDAGVQITEMNSGCICCSLVGDFGTALKQVITDYTPDRIIIEPSGVGKLSDVIKAVKDVSGNLDVELDSYTTVADVSKVKIYMKNFGEFFNNQIESANTIILSRTQTTTQDKIEKAVAMIREKNDHATIITTPWDEIDGAAIREAMQNYKSLEETMMDEDMIMTTTTAMSVHVAVTTMMTNMSIIITTTMSTSITTIMTSTSITTSTSIIMITTMAMSVHVAAMTMITIIIMQMRYLQAGARRHHTSTMRTNSERSLTLWLTQRSTVLSSEQRVSYLAMQVSGCTLILYQASSRSERARLTSLVSFA